MIESQVPLSEMFGYSTVLRSLTQGKAQFTMEFATYRQVPQSIAEEIAKKQAGREEECCLITESYCAKESHGFGDRYARCGRMDKRPKAGRQPANKIHIGITSQ